jgi:hypothetical protein
MIMTERNSVVAPLGYLAELRTPPRYRIYPPAQDKDESPPNERHDVRIFDCREVANTLALDVEGFVVRDQTSAIENFFDDETVRSRYYAEVEALVKEVTVALLVVVFDHNLRSVEKAAKGETGVRAPVDAVHNDSSFRRPLRIAIFRMNFRVGSTRLWLVIDAPAESNQATL